MNYPLHASDLADPSATSDDEATLIVIEALLTQSYNDIVFRDESRREDIRENVVSWEHYNETVAMIHSQKQLLSSVLPSPLHEPYEFEADFPGLNDSIARALHSVRQRTWDRRSLAMFTLSAAACLAFVVLTFTSVVSSSSKNSINTASRESTSSSVSSPADATQPDAATADEGIDGQNKGETNTSVSSSNSSPSITTEKKGSFAPVATTVRAETKPATTRSLARYCALAAVLFAVACILFRLYGRKYRLHKEL